MKKIHGIEMTFSHYNERGVAVYYHYQKYGDTIVEVLWVDNSKGEDENFRGTKYRR